jgi:outer membrane protein OmpA-like peptidoglycan-associated protein
MYANHSKQGWTLVIKAVLAAVTTVALLLGGPLHAQAKTTCDTLPAVLSSDATAAQIHCALSRSQSNSLTRAISIVETDPDIQAVSFAITFEFGSAALTAESQALLNTVAQVIAGDTALSKSAYFIDGHTDAVGSLAANQKLGKDRAQAAAVHLLGGLDIPLAVKIRSFGETRLLDPNVPNADLNRRVEITPVSSE